MKQNTDFSLRKNVDPAVPLPICARSAGHFRIDQSFVGPDKVCDFLQLFWGISGLFVYRRNGQLLELHPDKIGFLFPGEEHYYRAVNDETELCWLTFDGPRVCDMENDYHLPREIITSGHCPAELFLQLEIEIRDQKNSSQYQATSTALRILHLALGGQEEQDHESNLVERFRNLAKECFCDHSCGIDMLAEKLGIHRGTLSRLITPALGCSPLQYLTELRMRHAVELLASGKTVAETARLCGYSNANYLAKVMRRELGKVPSEFRR